MMSHDAMLQRVPPQNLEAEQATIGAMLLEKEAAEAAIELLTEEDFYREGHRWIYRGIAEHVRRGTPCDMVTLGEWLRSRATTNAPATEEDNLLALVGGTIYLTTIMQAAPTAAGVRHYAGIVREKSLQRQLIKAADTMMHDAYIGARPVDVMMREAEAALLSLSDRSCNERLGKIKTLREVIRDGAERRRAADKHGYDMGYKPSLRELNKLLLPLGASNLWVVGGEPSRGKSVLAFQIGIEMAEQGASVLIASLEMDEDMIARRMVQAATGMNMFDAEQINYRSDHTDEVYRGWYRAEETMPENIMLLDTPDASPLDLLAVGRRARRAMGSLDVLIVDYLQLMRSDSEEDNRDDTRRVTSVSRGMKRLAKQLKTGVIVVSSLNRPGQESENRRPSMNRLRQSGQIDYDVDVAMFVHRPERENKERVEVIVDKQRNGPTGTIELQLDLERLWFKNRSPVM